MQASGCKTLKEEKILFRALSFTVAACACMAGQVNKKYGNLCFLYQGGSSR